MQSSNIPGAFVLQSNGTKRYGLRLYHHGYVVQRLDNSPNPNYASWTFSLSPEWQSRPDVNGLDQRLSDDFTWSRECVEEMQYVVILTLVLIGS